MIAWELNRYAHSILRSGIGVPAQNELLHLQRNISFQAQIAMRDRIIQVRDHWLNHYKDKPDHLSQIARHFQTFDPARPDYSQLSDSPAASESRGISGETPDFDKNSK